MSALWWIVAVTAITASSGALLAACLFLGRRFVASRSAAMIQRAKDLFQIRREWLEAEFLTVASQSGRPRGLNWSDCDFQNGVSFARDRQSGELNALVGVAISFEAIEDGGMEDNPNVGNLRAATALFRFDGKHWNTNGRAIFNLEPDEAIEHFRNELETVD